MTSGAIAVINLLLHDVVGAPPDTASPNSSPMQGLESQRHGKNPGHAAFALRTKKSNVPPARGRLLHRAFEGSCLAAPLAFAASGKNRLALQTAR